MACDCPQPSEFHPDNYPIADGNHQKSVQAHPKSYYYHPKPGRYCTLKIKDSTIQNQEGTIQNQNEVIKDLYDEKSIESLGEGESTIGLTIDNSAADDGSSSGRASLGGGESITSTTNDNSVADHDGPHRTVSSEELKTYEEI